VVISFSQAVDSRPMFFNLFSEVEPFAAILIGHGTYVFLGAGFLRPERPKFEAEGGRGSWRGAASPLHTS